MLPQGEGVQTMPSSPSSEESAVRHLIAFLGTYPHWKHLPVVGSTASGELLAFFDSRQPLAERRAHADRIVREHGVTSVCRVVTAAGGCEEGIHDWRQVGTSLCCANCPRVEPAAHWQLDMESVPALV